MGSSLDNVKLLREKTGAGMMDCKKALAESEADVDRAVEWLRRKGIARSAKFAEKKATEGLVHAYIHPGGRIGVILEVKAGEKVEAGAVLCRIYYTGDERLEDAAAVIEDAFRISNQAPEERDLILEVVG